MNEEKSIEDIVKSVKKETAELQEKQNQYYSGLLADSRETVRSLALVSGGIATGALVILGSNIKIVSTFIILGIVILLVEVIIVIGYLLHVQNIAAEEYFTVRKKTIQPRGEILFSYLELKDKKITFQEFEKRLVDNTKQIKNYTDEVNTKSQNENPHTDNWDIVFYGLLLMGSSFLILGLLIPHLCEFWLFMCV